MKLKFGLLITMIIGSIAGYSQLCTSPPYYTLDGYCPNSCNFPDDGNVITDEMDYNIFNGHYYGIYSFIHVTNSSNGLNFASRLQIGGNSPGCQQFSDVFDDALTESEPHLAQSNKLCVPFSSSPYFIRGRVIENRSQDSEVRVYDYQITGSDGSVFFGTNYEHGTSGNNSSAQALVSIYLKPGVSYKITGTVGYIWPGGFLGAAVEHSHVPFWSYICVGYPGGGGEYTPVASTSNCSGNIDVDKESGLDYYWTTSSTFSNSNPFGSSNSVHMNTIGTYYVWGYEPNSGYISRPATVVVNSLVVPSDPVYSGGRYLCGCNPASNITVGANADGLKWYSGTNNNWAEITSDQIAAQILLGNKIAIASSSSSTGCISNIVPLNIAVLPCDVCQNTFAPIPGNKYVLSAWVSNDDDYAMNATDFSKSKITLHFTGGSQSSYIDFTASGKTVEGWQRIENEFTVPAWAEKMNILFKNENTANSYNAYFDDFRIHPFNASMITYVYNQETMQLEAQMDENNFYTRYIYDDEGNLVKTNVETIEGVRTVAETRSNIAH